MSEETKEPEIDPETLEDIISRRTVVKVMGRPLTLDPARLQFNEVNLSEFIEQEASWYDYFGNALADAEAQLAYLELQHEAKYYTKFHTQKDEGDSDKKAEAAAKSDPEVHKCKEATISAKRTVKMIQSHLRAWDKNHDNAQSRGHMIRKEMDKLGADIHGSRDNIGAGRPQNDIEKSFEEIYGKREED